MSKGEKNGPTMVTVMLRTRGQRASSVLRVLRVLQDPRPARSLLRDPRPSLATHALRRWWWQGLPQGQGGGGEA